MKRLRCLLLAICLGTAAASAQEADVYSDQGFFSRWSDQAVGVTFAGKRFHGPFGNQPVSLSVDRLPEHHWVRVTFDLYIVGSWDGSSPVWGPDLWSLSVRRAQRLISATFCAWGYAGNNEQSFPDDYPHAIHPAWTGGTRQAVVDLPGDERPVQSGVYRVEALFPHEEASLVLDFTGAYEDPAKEPQTWGIGDVRVQAFAANLLTDKVALPALWEELASPDSVKANAALWHLVGAGAGASEFIKGQVAQIAETARLSSVDNLRLHRAHRIVRIIGGPGSADLCFRMEHLSNEYLTKYGR